MLALDVCTFWSQCLILFRSNLSQWSQTSQSFCSHTGALPSRPTKTAIYWYIIVVTTGGDMGLVLLWTIYPPTRHEFDIFNTPFLPFEFEITIDGEEESIEESVLCMMINERRKKRNETYNKTPAFSQPSGRLRLGWGHAGHSTVSSPLDVASTPARSWPRPPRLSAMRFRHILKTRWISEYRFC